MSAALAACAPSAPAPSSVDVDLGPTDASAGTVRVLPPRAGSARPSAATPIVWETDADRAASRARRERRPLLVAACASWSAACGAQEEALRDDRVARAAAPFVALRLDLTEDTPEANALASRFHVVGVPSIVLVATDGREEHLDRAATSSAEAIAERLGAFVSR